MVKWIVLIEIDGGYIVIKRDSFRQALNVVTSLEEPAKLVSITRCDL
jgi:hypothetical protein